MTGYLRIGLVVCALFATTVAMMTYGHVTGFDNLIPVDVTALQTVRTEIDCGRSCKRSNGGCVSFFYINSTPPACLPQSLVWNNTQTLVHMDGAQYFTERAVYYPFSCPTPSVYTSVTLSDGTVFTYSFYTTYLSHMDAHAHCNSEGAILAKVTTQAKLDMIYQIRSLCPAVSHSVWIDGNNIGATDYTIPAQWTSYSTNASLYTDLTLWKTTTNDPIEPSFWKADQPNALGTDHCLYMWELIDQNTFSDAACTLVMYNTLCEKP